MVLIVQATHAQEERSISWISLQPDGAVSVGLVDRAFVSPRFHARQFVWNAYNRVAVQYLVPHSPNELRSVTNPHLTFHPPNYFHLKANEDAELFAGIADVEIMLDQDGQVPWLRFVSRPIAEVPVASTPRNAGRTSILTLPVSSPDVSVGLSVDFVRQGTQDSAGCTAVQFFAAGQFRLRVCCEALPPQEATLAWYHQY